MDLEKNAQKKLTSAMEKLIKKQGSALGAGDSEGKGKVGSVTRSR